MVAATVETGQPNMANLEQSVVKDNTLMPGEWHGGQLHLAPPTDQPGGQKSYTITAIVELIGTLLMLIKDRSQGSSAHHDVSAFANSDGGQIVYGMKENKDHEHDGLDAGWIHGNTQRSGLSKFSKSTSRFC
jgi:hypothetical protein